MKLSALTAGLALATLISSAALAQGAPPTRVRGEVAGLDGNMLTVKSREGTAVMIKLADNWAAGLVSPVPASTIKKGAFVGIAAKPDRDGRLIAIEVLVLPEAMRGLGEGHYPWDLEPGSNMTNATIDATVIKGGSRTLKVSYKGGTQSIVVPKAAPVVTLGPGERSLVKPGAFVLVSATKGADGSLTAARIAVGKDGSQPPM
ncbi:MAG TPA: DUF5666 domain-containing protein [Candidatus Sulfotelmatobacter sp.]|nr:DUF5666 domain-containing protein [Candidatus Sulfotelmatobacter sp.]